MEQTFQWINSFLEQLFAYGPVYIYLALLTASFIENVFPPFPGDFFTLAGGALAAAGWLNIFTVFLIVYAGGIGSTMVVYYLGRRFGRNYFIKKDFRYFSAADINNMETWFNRRGALLLFFSRFIIGARAALAIVGGMSRYEPGKFFLFSSLSFWLFNSLLLFSSYLFVVNFDTIATWFRTYERIAWPVIIAAVVILAVMKIRKVLKNGRKA
jgi:membrane protein DedA with SNARE-associated domain